jgi:hypothetical protein
VIEFKETVGAAIVEDENKCKVTKRIAYCRSKTLELPYGRAWNETICFSQQFNVKRCRLELILQHYVVSFIAYGPQLIAMHRRLTANCRFYAIICFAAKNAVNANCITAERGARRGIIW